MKTEQEAIGKIKLKLDSDESRKRWELIKQASEEVNHWDELKKAEAYRRNSSNEHEKPYEQAV